MKEATFWTNQTATKTLQLGAAVVTIFPKQAGLAGVRFLCGERIFRQRGCRFGPGCRKKLRVDFFWYHGQNKGLPIISKTM
jgi:hypothetical protein